MDELNIDKTAERHLAEAVLENLPDAAMGEACERLLLLRRKYSSKKKMEDEARVPQY